MIRALGLAILASLLSLAALAANDPAERGAMRRIIVEEALNSPLPPSLALALAKVESNFDPRALSGKGARGLMQIMPETARGLFGVAADELWNARLNAQLGIDYLARLVRTYGGRWDLALSHYNGGGLAGTGRTALPHSFTRSYVDAVLKWERVFAGELAAERRNEGWVPAQTPVLGPQVAEAKPAATISPPVPPAKAPPATATPGPVPGVIPPPARPLEEAAASGRWTQIGATVDPLRVIADQARALERLTELLARRSFLTPSF
jgi:hypothetical protein